MYLTEALQKKWGAVLDCEDLPKIPNAFRRAVTAQLLENMEIASKQDAQILNETLPTNFAGTGGYATQAAAGGPVAGFDPILISLMRRALPHLMAYDVMGVQPMTGPTGLIFAMRSTYGNTTISTGNTESLYNEANTAFSGNGVHSPFNTGNTNPGASATNMSAPFAALNFGLANTGYGYPNGIGEDLGGATALNQMGFSIEKVTVTANTRGLAASYTLELAQDLKAIHGLDAETELSNILSTEILTEINRESVRTIYATSNIGCATANIVGVYDLATGVDSDGRWQVEKYKGLIFQIERECNKIGKDTRRGKGNMLICSTDVASALSLSGMLDYSSGMAGNGTNLNVDDNLNTFAGVLMGRIKVFVDPYSVAGADWIVCGYKGPTAYDAGLFYCPYVPLQMVRAIDPNTFQPKIGFKTRYGMVANPFAEGTGQGLGRLANNTNCYYRKFLVYHLK